MAQTLKHQIPYPGPFEAPDGPFSFQAQAERVDALVDGIKYAPFGHMGKTNASQSLVSPVKVVFTQAQILRGGMTFDATDSGRLVLPLAGLYRLTLRGFATGAAANRNRYYVIKNGVVATPVAGCDLTFDKATGDDFGQSCSGSDYFAAGDKLGVYGVSPVSTWGTTGFNGIFLEAEYMGPN